jgi:hypothetical protein
MSLHCYFLRREIEQTAMTDGGIASPRLAVHLEACPKCRVLFQDSQAMACELTVALSIPEAGEDFVENVWRRIEQARPAPAKRWSPALVATAAVVVIVTIIALRANTPPEVPDTPGRVSSGAAAQQLVKNVDDSDRVGAGETRKSPAGASAGSRKSPQKSATSGRHEPVVRPRRNRTRRSTGRRLSAPRTKRMLASNTPQTTVKKQEPVRPKWASLGAWFEARGEYMQAATAYGRAYQEGSDPSLAFAAGRSAECAGDVAQAVEYYTQILIRKPEADKQPEKGSSLWTQDRDSA